MMDAFANSELAQKYQVLSVREKLLLISTAVVVLYLLFSLIFLTPLDETEKSLRDSLANEQQQQVSIAQQLVTVTRSLVNDPDQTQKRQQKALQEQRRLLDESLAKMSAGLVPADQLPVVLKQVLANLDGVELVSMNTLPAEELRFDAPPANDQSVSAPASLTAEVDDGSVGMFKHGVSVNFVGDYFRVVDYLKTLEALPWRFYWDLVDYQVESYPKARVELQVYTLSTEVGSLGS